MQWFKKKRVSRADVILDEIDIIILNSLKDKKLIASDIRDKLFLTDKSLALHTERLIKLGLIEYERTGDKNRFKLYSLTKNGMIIIDTLQWKKN